MAGNQANLFIIFSLVGIIIGLLFDIFRVLRKVFKTKDILTYIEDILFWILTGIIIIYSMYRFCDGELRFFMIVGIIFGSIIYILSISKYIIFFFTSIFSVIKKIIINPAKLICKTTRKIIFRRIFVLCINFRKKICFLVKKTKN